MGLLFCTLAPEAYLAKSQSTLKVVRGEKGKSQHSQRTLQFLKKGMWECGGRDQEAGGLGSRGVTPKKRCRACHPDAFTSDSPPNLV